MARSKTNEPAKRTRAPREPKDYDYEIGRAEARLADLKAAKKEKDRRELEVNTQEIVALIKRHGWNAIGAEQWESVAGVIDSALRGNGQKATAEQATEYQEFTDEARAA